MKEMLVIGPDKTTRKCRSFGRGLIRDFTSKPGFGPKNAMGFDPDRGIRLVSHTWFCPHQGLVWKSRL